MFNGISIFMGYLKLKPFLQKNSSDLIKGAYKGVYTFTEGISSKVSIIVQVEFKLAYFGVAV